MKLEPIIQAKLLQYKADYNFETLDDSIIFEKFVNQTILTSHQPNAFSNYELLDNVCVGGINDTGIDGLCIKLNDTLISSLKDAKEYVSLNRKIHIELIFIQSKYKKNFTLEEYSTFIRGIENFISEKHCMPMNDKIKEYIKIKEYLMSNDVMTKLEDMPSIRIYYVVMGVWTNNLQIKGLSQNFIMQVEKERNYSLPLISYIDADSLKKIWDNNNNNFSVSFDIIDTFSLQEVEKVNNSSIVLISGNELIKLLTNDDQLIRKNLFNNNVRDFQGNTTINSEILKTINDNPATFVLANNGVTIVCDDLIVANRKVKITNPQIVNGCQTCNVLYKAHQSKKDISNISILAKIISTTDDDIVSKIVKGTNRQNIVYDEIFEITREFHKKMEEFFEVLSKDKMNKIYYERRSKQYSSVTQIKPFQKVNFRIFIQSFISVFFNTPHEGHRHESILLQKYKNKIFNDKQSKLPYYISSLIFNMIDNYFRRHNNECKYFLKYKAQIAFLFKQLFFGDSPNINSEKEIDLYCKTIMEVLQSNEQFEKNICECFERFQQIKDSWIKLKGEQYKDSIKDNSEFTKFMLNELKTNIPVIENRGAVIYIGTDKNNMKYGFISKEPYDIFFHVNKNKNLDFDNLLWKDVLYDIEKYGDNKEVAINVKIIKL